MCCAQRPYYSTVLYNHFCTRRVNTWLLRRTGEHYSSTPAAYFPLGVDKLGEEGLYGKNRTLCCRWVVLFHGMEGAVGVAGDNSVDPWTTPRRYRLYKFDFCKNQNRPASSTIVAGLLRARRKRRKLMQSCSLKLSKSPRSV